MRICVNYRWAVLVSRNWSTCWHTENSKALPSIRTTRKNVSLRWGISRITGGAGTCGTRFGSRSPYLPADSRGYGIGKSLRLHTTHPDSARDSPGSRTKYPCGCDGKRAKQRGTRGLLLLVLGINYSRRGACCHQEDPRFSHPNTRVNAQPVSASGYSQR